MATRRQRTQALAEDAEEMGSHGNAEVMGAFSTQSQAVIFAADPSLVDDFHDKRQRQAYEMRLQGYTWQAIAEACGYADGSGAYKAAHAVASQLHSDSTPDQERDMVSGIFDTILTRLMGDLDTPMSPSEKHDDDDGASDKPRKRRPTNLWVVDRLNVTLENYAKLRGLHRVDPNAIQAQVLIRDITADTSQV